MIEMLRVNLNFWQNIWQSDNLPNHLPENGYRMIIINILNNIK